MRKSFTQLFGFLLLSVFMLFSSGLVAQETQSTVELYAGTVDACYNASDSYTAKISVKDFIEIKSFIIVLNYDATKFAFKGVSVIDASLSSLGYSNDPVDGSLQIWWTNTTGVTIGDNEITDVLGVEFGVVGFPNNAGTNSFASALTWDSAEFWYAPEGGGEDEVRTTTTSPGSLNVNVNYNAITYTVDAATCAGSTATIHITSPVGAGLQYYFNGSTTPSTTPVADAQAPSTNTVRIKDANGCYSHLFTIPVGAPSPLTLIDVTTEDPLCFNDNGEIQFEISGGTAPYTYWVVEDSKWATVDADLNTKLASDPVFNNYKFNNFQVLKPAGTYHVAVNDANGCLDLRDDANWQTVTITPITSAISFTATPTGVQCNGGTDGSIAITAVAGGTIGDGYTVSIDGIHWYDVVAGSYTFDELAGGIYSVVVKDGNGCTTTQSVTVAQPAAIAFTLSYEDASCAGGATGSISISSVSGGTAPYEFVVATAGSAMPVSGWVATSSTIGSLEANYYSVWVRDANGCVKAFANQDGTGNVLPIQAPGALTFTTNADDAAAIEVSCNDGDFTLTVTAAGGTAPYTYSFDGGSTYASANTLDLTGLVVDEVVSVYVKDANDCIANRTVTVDVPDALAFDVFTNILSPTCPMGNDGRATVNVIGGVAPYMYSTDNVTWYANKVLALPEGETLVYVKDAKGCTASATVDAGTLTPSAFDADPTDVISCNGDDETEGIAITNYTWEAGRTVQFFVASSSATVFTSGTVFVPASINGTPGVDSDTFGAGTYYVGARDEYGCTSAIQEVIFTEEPALQISSVVKTDATCSGLFNGTLTINTAGGNDSPILYAIVNNSLAIGNLTAGDFQPIDTYNSTTNIGQQIVQAQRGTYYVVLRNSCITDNSLFAGPFIVDGYKPIELDEENYPLSVTDITCHDDDNGIIAVNNAGVSGGKPEYDGTGAYTFKLYMTGEGDVLVATNTTGVFTGLEAGDYYITITDATNCPMYTTETVEVVNPALLVIEDVDITHFTCQDSNDGMITVDVAGGTGNYWLAVNASVNGTGTDIKASDWIAFPTATPSSKTYIATEPGAYKLFVKDANGCLAAPVTVTVLEPEVLTLTTEDLTNVTCNGGSDGSVQVNVSGGWDSEEISQSFVFATTEAGLATSTNTTGAFSGLTAGSYTVYAKATNAPSVDGDYTYPTVACVYQVSFVITEPTPFAYHVDVDNVACKGGADGALTVTVNGGGSPNVDGEYYVQLITTTHPYLVVEDWVETDGKVAVFENLAHAHYSVYIMDASGCILPIGAETSTDGIWHTVQSWEVNEPATALSAEVAWNNDVTCYGGNDGKYTVTAAGGVAPYKYAAKISVLPAHVFAPDPNSTEWQTSNVFASATAGTWIIWVMDANGCIVGGEGGGTPVDEWRVQVMQPQQVDFSLTSTEPSCYGTATGTVTATSVVSDAGYPYTITVTGVDAAGNAVNISQSIASGAVTATGVPASVTKPVYSEPTPNAFTVTVADKNGCSNSHTIVIWQNPMLTVGIVKADGAFLCPGDNSGVIEAVAVGGTETYSYRLWRDGVAYTSWVSIPSFLVEIGHTWAVEVKDANGCTATDEMVINEPVGVTALLQETTCYSDAKASVIVSATGEPGRTFAVRYRLNTAVAFGAWMDLNSENKLAIANLEFANVTETENFYYFQVKDSQGCMTEEIKHSFVPTQHPLQVAVLQSDDQLSASITITGGISPYSYQVGEGEMIELPVDGDTFQVVDLLAGSNVVTVYDAHGCSVPEVVVVDPVSVTAVPANGNNMDQTFDVVLTFNRDVTIPEGGITVTGGTAVVAGSGKEYTVSITAEDLAAVSIALANTIVDAAGNALEATAFNYTVGDHVAPTVVVTDPVAPVATVFTVGLAFSEPVSGVLDKTGLTVTGGTLSDVTGEAGGMVYTLTVSSTEQTEVSIVLSDVIKDISLNTNSFAGQTLTYTTGDFTAPELVTWTPTDGETIADNHPLLKMTFSENVVVGDGGSLKIYKVNTTVVALDIPITAAMINGKDVTVDYTTQAGLDKDTRYYVLVDGTALEDNAGNTFAGVSDAAVWTFKTGPDFATPIIPVDGSLEFKVYPNPFVDFVSVANASKLSKIVVSNIAGQTVKVIVSPSDKIQLNELRSGVYFISMYNKDNVIAKTAKVVKR